MEIFDILNVFTQSPYATTTSDFGYTNNSSLFLCKWCQTIITTQLVCEFGSRDVDILRLYLLYQIVVYFALFSSSAGLLCGIHVLKENVMYKYIQIFIL